MDIVAELNVLHCMINHENARLDALSALKPSDFYSSVGRKCFKAIGELVSDGSGLDGTIIKAHVNTKDFSSKYDKLIKKIDDVKIEHYKEYINILQRTSQAEKAQEIFHSALTGLAEGNPAEIIKNTERKLLDLLITKETGFSTLKDDYAAMINRLKNPKEIRTVLKSSIPSLNEMVNIAKGDLVIVAGRPSMGKSSFLTDLMVQNGLHGDMPMLFFSIETRKQSQWQRILSNVTKVLAWKISTGIGLTGTDMHIIKEYHEFIHNDTNIMINDSAMMDIGTISAVSRKEKIKKPEIGAILIDYLQLAVVGDDTNKATSDFSRGLKLLARDLDIPIIAVSQLSRKCDMRENKRPMLSDLRDSGALEQDADTVIFLYRDWYYHRQGPDDKKCEIIIAKQREGGVGTVHCGFEKEKILFTEMP